MHPVFLLFEGAAAAGRLKLAGWRGRFAAIHSNQKGNDNEQLR
jgi:hypothetical protein